MSSSSALQSTAAAASSSSSSSAAAASSAASASAPPPSARLAKLREVHARAQASWLRSVGGAPGALPARLRAAYPSLAARHGRDLDAIFAEFWQVLSKNYEVCKKTKIPLHITPAAMCRTVATAAAARCQRIRVCLLCRPPLHRQLETADIMTASAVPARWAELDDLRARARARGGADAASASAGAPAALLEPAALPPSDEMRALAGDIAVSHKAQLEALVREVRPWRRSRTHHPRTRADL